MINKRLIKMGDTKPVFAVVICNWLAMMLNVAFIFRLAFQLAEMYEGRFETSDILITLGVLAVVIVGRVILKRMSSKYSHKASSKIKLKLRKQIYDKTLKLGEGYREETSTAELIQISTEGVDQLETYFGSYLPQFFYCMIAPITLFMILAPISFTAALVLFICVPLIPVSIIIIQKIAKKLLSKYWGLYAKLGDNFLENVQGMTTLKIYEADKHYHEEMNKSAEHFRRITMKVLTMQLNSIIVMDTVAYGGTALGAIMAIAAVTGGSMTLFGAVAIMLLASEFFLPMRMLGSFFHIAMNGMAAADKMFGILDTKEPEHGHNSPKSEIRCVEFKDVGYAYGQKEVLKDACFTAKVGMTALVGVSGCGKSTLAGIMCKDNVNYFGSVLIEGDELRDIEQNKLYEILTAVSDKSYVFTGTVRENLLIAAKSATDEQLITALKSVKLWDFLQNEKGLDTMLNSGGSNFSGGQRGRLCIARALLRKSLIYVFDEVTSNIDAESENAIMEVIRELAQHSIVFIISHRLANVKRAQQIVLLKDGKISAIGTHEELMKEGDFYSELYEKQRSLEEYGRNYA